MPAKNYTLTTCSGVLIKEWRKGKHYIFERRREMGVFSATLHDERKELFQPQCNGLRLGTSDNRNRQWKRDKSRGKRD